MIRSGVLILCLVAATGCFKAPMPATEAQLREDLAACREANRAILEAAVNYRIEADKLRDVCR